MHLFCLMREYHTSVFFSASSHLFLHSGVLGKLQMTSNVYTKLEKDKNNCSKIYLYRIKVMKRFPWSWMEDFWKLLQRQHSGMVFFSTTNTKKNNATLCDKTDEIFWRAKMSLVRKPKADCCRQINRLKSSASRLRYKYTLTLQCKPQFSPSKQYIVSHFTKH